MILSRRLFLAGASAVLVSPALATEPPGRYHVYIGTYTDPSGSKGIYRCELDVASGALSEPELVASLASPSFLAISPSGQFLYAVSETPKKSGEVFAYAIDAGTGQLTARGKSSSGGPGPCHLSVNSTGEYLLVANYGGSSAMFRLGADGSIGERTDLRKYKGKGTNKERQEASHPHCAVFRTTSEGEFAHVVDLGLDKVFSYMLDTTTGTLEATVPAFVTLPAGTGPRHIAFHREAGKAFVCGELTSTLVTLRAYEANGTLQMYGTDGLDPRPDSVLSTLPQGIADSVRSESSTAEIVVHPTSPHVLVSNRGHNSLAVFHFDADKTEAVATIEGQSIATPRSFHIDPTGRFIVIANQDGGNVSLVEWDSAGGGKPTGTAVSVSKPVCVVFLAKG